MERIRLGNNIAISWALYDLNGRVHSLEDKEVQLYVSCGGLKQAVTDYTIQGNVVSWVFLGTEQKKVGLYKLILVETDALSGAQCIDVAEAFRLVSETLSAVETGEVTKNVSVRSVLTYSNLVGVESVDVVESSEDGGTNLVSIRLVDGNVVEVPIKNGSKGEKGDTGATGATGPKGDKGNVGERGPKGVESVTASVDGTSGTPAVTPTYDGTTGALGLAFSGLKGEKGDKGDQGNTGSSVDYPYELVNNVTTNDATKGLSAAQGVVLDGKIGQLGQKVDGIDKELHESETVSPTLQRDGYYVKTNGTRGYYSPFGIFTPIPVKAGDRVVATINGYNSSASPISWGATDNTNSDMSVTPLAVYTPTNQYDVTIANDGYLIVCGDKTTTPIVTIYGEVYDFEQIEVNKNNIVDLTDRLRIEEKITPSIGKNTYFVDANGGRGNYDIMAIYGPIQVGKGDKVSATNMLSENETIAALAWSQSPSMNSDMSCNVLALGNSEGDATTIYEAYIPDDGYLFLSANKNTTPNLSVASISSLQPIVDDVNELSEKVADIDGALDDNTQIPVVIDKGGYFVNTSGTRGNYAPFAIFSPVSVKAGDKIIVGNIYVNAAICPLAFNTDGNTNSDMTSTPMSVFEDGKTTYSAVAPQDGYFIVSNDKTKTPTVEIAKLLDIPEIKQIGSLLSGKITMLFGDSLTAGSTTGVVAFGRVIANVLGIHYRAFVYDRFDPSPDTNPADVDIDIPSITNYGKDGTKNQITIGRVDSVLQRVKNHISADTIVDYVLIECCVNDYTSGTKGTISDSYTGPFDENTAIGAIEETCRYLSTLGKNLRFGFYIPWQILYVPEDYFNDYIPVFEKWGVPLFDMRKCAGFDMRNCVRHQELYSLPASSYANYDNTATYNLDDKVKYEGFLYKCNADGVTGILPTNETYWTKVSEGNFDGCHLNSLGHYIVAGKIQSFIERL